MNLKMSIPQKSFAFLLPAKAFNATKRGTEQWQVKCQCGYTQNLWETGGIRYGAYGNKAAFRYCQSCAKFRLHDIYKKGKQGS
jgi:hypothetical protein